MSVSVGRDEAACSDIARQIEAAQQCDSLEEEK
jgi:hypothetical protein